MLLTAVPCFNSCEQNWILMVSYSRKILLPMAANSANSCSCFNCRPLRTQEMVEMVEVAKALVLEEHSHLFTIQPVSISTNIVMLNEIL